MKDFSDVIVIGGGASGIMAAITAADSKKTVTILEHTDRIGKKILLTGNGRCNLTNRYMDEKCFCRENAGFAMEVIRDFDENAVMDFFRGIGLMLHERNGYVYPNSDQAASVNDILRMELAKRGVNVCTEITIRKIVHREAGNGNTGNKSMPKGRNGKFEIQTAQGTYFCDKLIVAAGSKAYPKTGSDGSGYELAKMLGHAVIEPLPALTALKSDFKLLKAVSGVRCDGLVRLFVNDREIIGERGEIQMTDYGISGIPVFQVSRYAVRAVNAGKKVFCVLDILPDYSEDEIADFMKKKQNIKQEPDIRREQGTGTLSLEEVTGGMVNKKLANMILKYLGYSLNDDGSKLKDKDLRKIAASMKQLRLNITGYNSFDYGQVCQGGVNVKEIDSKTMESKLIKGLYFAGEIVDVDGICGGYNLQWAWSSGYKAGRAAIQ